MDASKNRGESATIIINNAVPGADNSLSNRIQPSPSSAYSSECKVLPDSFCAVLKRQLELELIARDQQIEALSNEYRYMLKIRQGKNLQAKLLAAKQEKFKLKIAYLQSVKQCQGSEMSTEDLTFS